MAIPSLSLEQTLRVKVVRGVTTAVLGTMSLFKRGRVGPKQEFAYGPHPDQRLDYLPPGESTAKTDAIVYLHGGGWIAGSKNHYPADLQFLTRAGFPVFNIDYPLAPENPHPHIIRSVFRAIAWIKRNHPEIQSVHVMGDSAGGTLATMYAVLFTNPELLRQIDPVTTPDELLPPKSVVSLYGLLDRETILGEDPEQAPAMALLFLYCYGGADAIALGRLPAEQAITPMDLDWQHHPRCFLGLGDRDFLLESSERYARHLRSMDIPCVHKIYPKATHGFLNMGHRQTPVLKEDVLAFLEAG